MAKNDFKPFATGADANVLSQAEFEALEAVGNGFQSGIARSEELNKVWRQASTIASVVASFMATKSGNDVLDNGDVTALQATLLKALLNNSTSQLDGRYLKATSNLSELNNVATARANLKLGTAATANTQASPTDTTAGRLMAVGAFGLGKGTYTGTGDDTIPVASRNLGWGVFRSHGASDAPSAAYVQMMVMGDSSASNAQRSLLAIDAANNGWLGSISTTGVVKWSTIFTSTNKPTAADTNAVPLLANGVVNAINRIQNITSIFTPKTATPLELGQMSGVEGDFYLDIHTDGKEDGEDYSHRVTFIRGGGVDINSVSGGRVTIGGNGGEVVPSNYANFDARYQAKGSYTPAGQAYTKAESDGRFIHADSVSTAGFVSNNINQPYMRHKSSNTVVNLARTDYAYSKGEADERYLSSIQRGSQSLYNGAHTTTVKEWEAPAGGFMTGVNIRADLGDVRAIGIYYRSLMMKTASGGWVQIGN